MIRKHFGVRHHPDHVGRLLHKLDWSPQKPETRALQRDEEAIALWKRKGSARSRATRRRDGKVADEASVRGETVTTEKRHESGDSRVGYAEGAGDLSPAGAFIDERGDWA